MFVYPLCFLFELLVSEAVFLSGQKRKSGFLLRSLLMITVSAGLAIGLNYLFSFLPDTIPVRIVFFLLFFGISVFAIFICFYISFAQIIFIATAGYSVEHIADSLLKILFVFTPLGKISDSILSILILTIPYVLCALLFYRLFIASALLNETMQSGDKRVLAIAGVNLIICMALSVIIDHVNLSGVATAICKTYAIFGCILCLLIQVGLFRDGKKTRENAILQQMMLMERSQHKISKETIDFINIKCHDLKHQLDKLGSLNDERRQKSIAEISDAIMIYDSIVKTGNDALDVVLMEKKLLCEKYHIQLSYIVQGDGINWISEVDIYSLFGNILDNAIESLQQETDEEKRVVTLSVRTHMKMLYINADNYCSTPILYENGEIKTTKQHEVGMHGYGLKSIKHIVDSYGGDLLIDTSNNHFVLQIMIPQEKSRPA
jgi:hypothetical protein